MHEHSGTLTNWAGELSAPGAHSALRVPFPTRVMAHLASPIRPCRQLLDVGCILNFNWTRPPPLSTLQMFLLRPTV